MAYNDKRLKTDLEGKPIPQAYNPDIDDYEPVHSTNNALNQVIYGPNGQPISTVGNKLAVRATELEALMQGLATEGKLEQVRQLLSGVATENKLEQARALLEAISTKDFATSSKQDALKIAVEDLKSELNLVKSELAAIKANQLSGDQKVQLTGSNLALRQTIVTGAKTVASTAAEIFAGGSRLAGRHAMVITNVGVGHVYIGASGVTTNNGFPLFPGDTIRIDFNPASNVPVFAVSDGANINVRVVELA